MAVLITGGAGYIGSHIVMELLASGAKVIVIDDLSSGLPTRLGNSPFAQIDVSRPESVAELAAVMLQHEVDSVIHLAGRKSARESVVRPLWYYQQNVVGLHNVLSAMSICGITSIVFSSSSAVYGNCGPDPVKENSPIAPISPYGKTKMACEWMLEDSTTALGVRAVSLRYFNVVGSAMPELGDRSDFNVVPSVFRAIDRGVRPLIFGDDYATPDGSCIRDYVHVIDVARAHVAALSFVTGQPAGTYDVFNVGTGDGTSVKQIVSMALEVSESRLLPEVQARLEGDPAAATADVTKIYNTLGWRATHSMHDMIGSAWESFLSTSNECSTRE